MAFMQVHKPEMKEKRRKLKLLESGKQRHLLWIFDNLHIYNESTVQPAQNYQNNTNNNNHYNDNDQSL